MAIAHAEVASHIREHMDYPGTKADLVARCNDMSDVPAEEREWFIANLPDGTYNSADEVLQALGL